MTNADNTSHQLSVQEFLIAIRDETSIEAELIDLKNAGEQSEGDRALAVELRSALREIASLILPPFHRTLRRLLFALR